MTFYCVHLLDSLQVTYTVHVYTVQLVIFVGLKFQYMYFTLSWLLLCSYHLVLNVSFCVWLCCGTYTCTHVRYSSLHVSLCMNSSICLYSHYYQYLHVACESLIRLSNVYICAIDAFIDQWCAYDNKIRRNSVSVNTCTHACHCWLHLMLTVSLLTRY